MMYHHLSEHTQRRHQDYMDEAINMYNNIFLHGFGRKFDFSYEIRQEVEPLYVMGRSVPIHTVQGKKTLSFSFNEMQTNYLVVQKYPDDVEFCQKVLSFFFLLVEEQELLLAKPGIRPKLVYPTRLAGINIDNKLNRKFLPHLISFYLEKTIPYKRYIRPKINTFISSQRPNLSL